MAEIKSFPNNQDEYVGAQYLMRWFHGRTSGVFGAEENAAVLAVDGEMAVTVTDGTGWMSNENADGIVWWNDSLSESGSALTLSVDLADGVLDRIDRVVVSWQTTNYVARPTIEILKGVASGSPEPPALTNNNVLRQISLARISIPAGTLSLKSSLITDERLDETVCGLVTENLKADTTMLNAQMADLIKDVQSQTDDLIGSIENELASIVGGTGFDPSPIRVENVAITPESFLVYEAQEGTEEALLFEMGYEYRAFVAVENVLGSMFPYVTLSLPSIEAAGVQIANQFEAVTGGIYVYSDGVPEQNIIALTVECRKGVGLMGWGFGNVSAAPEETRSASTITAGTFQGIVAAQNNTAYTTKQVRNISLNTANPSGGSNGDLWFTYSL